MQILLCESCKFGEKICYNNWDNEFFLRDCFLLVHPVYPSQTKNYVFVCNAWLLLWLAASTQQSLYTLQWTCKCPPHKCRFLEIFYLWLYAILHVEADAVCIVTRLLVMLDGVGRPWSVWWAKYGNSFSGHNGCRGSYADWHVCCKSSLFTMWVCTWDSALAVICYLEVNNNTVGY